MKWARKVAAFSARSSGQSREACQGIGLTCEKCLMWTATVSGSSGSRRWATGSEDGGGSASRGHSVGSVTSAGDRGLLHPEDTTATTPPPPTHTHSGPGTGVRPAGGRQSGQGAGLAHAALGEPAPAPQRTFTLQSCLSALLSVPPTQSTPSCPGTFAQATQGPPLVPHLLALIILDLPAQTATPHKGP